MEVKEWRTMSQKNRHKVLDVVAEVVPINQKEALEDQLRVAGFDPMQLTEFEKALLFQIGWAKHDVVEAIDELGAMLEDYLGEGEE
jgi:hypothetical protein